MLALSTFATIIFTLGGVFFSQVLVGNKHDSAYKSIVWHIPDNYHDSSILNQHTKSPAGVVDNYIDEAHDDNVPKRTATQFDNSYASTNAGITKPHPEHSEAHSMVSNNPRMRTAIRPERETGHNTKLRVSDFPPLREETSRVPHLTTTLYLHKPIRESIVVYRPFSISPPQTKLTFTNFRCRKLAHWKMPDEIRGTCEQSIMELGSENSFVSYPGILRRLYPKSKPDCNRGSVVLTEVSRRDANVCHLLMRILLVHNVIIRRKHIHMPPVTAAVLVVPHRRIRKILRNSDSFHSGLLNVLFINHGIQVIITSSLDTIHDTCYDSVAVVGSFCNRFAYADAAFDSEIDPRNRYSTDLHALRAHVLPIPPRMQYKLLYVRRLKGKRTWNVESEQAMGEMLEIVAEITGAKLQVFEGRGNFHEQITPFTDAAVVVGMHGAGLALCAFCPPGAAIVEIAPAYHKLGLFSRLVSGGIAHEFFRLSKGTTVKMNISSTLIESDESRLMQILIARLRERESITTQ